MTATSISALPPELLLQIWTLLSTEDMSAITKVCRKLRHIAEPSLYYTIHMNCQGNRNVSPVKLLLRTLLERPNLPQFIRRLIFQGRGFCLGYQADFAAEEFWREGQFETLSRSCQLSKDRLSEITESIASSQGITRFWPEEVLAGNTDAVVALITAMSPNLEDLYIDRKWTIQTRYISHVAKAAVVQKSKQPPLQRLRDISLSQYDDADSHRKPRDTNDLLCLFDLPQVQHISLPIQNPVKFSWPLSSAPLPSTVASLELTRMRECFLGDVLSRLENLQKLRFNLLYRTDVDRHVSNGNIDLDALLAALLKHKDTLVELEIDARSEQSRKNFDIEWPSVYVRGSLKGLYQLYKLKRMEVPWNFLMGAHEVVPTGALTSTLPPNLEHLALGPGILILDSDHDWEDAEVLARIESELEVGGAAHLRSVCLPPSNTPGGVKPADKAELDNVSRRLNVSLSQFPDKYMLGPAFGCFVNLNTHRLLTSQPHS